MDLGHLLSAPPGWNDSRRICKSLLDKFVIQEGTPCHPLDSTHAPRAALVAVAPADLECLACCRHGLRRLGCDLASKFRRERTGF